MLRVYVLRVGKMKTIRIIKKKKNNILFFSRILFHISLEESIRCIYGLVPLYEVLE